MTRSAVPLLLLVAACGGDGVNAPRPAPLPPSAPAAPAAPGTPPSPPSAPARFALTVNGGAGSGSFVAGDTVSVAALFNAATGVLGDWAGDVALLPAPSEWSARFVMPARAVTLAATVRAISAPLTVATAAGSTARLKTYRYFTPAAPRGLMLMFHGTSGSSRVITSGEGYAIALEAVAAGYAVLASESEETVAGDLDADGKIRWDIELTTGNVDFANLDALVTSLRQRGIISGTLPLYAMGMSNGSSMVTSLGAIAAVPALATRFPALRFRAVAGYCAQGGPGATTTTRTPTAFYLCRQDANENVGADGNARAVSQSAAMSARGVATDVAWNEPSPLHDERFARSPLVSATTSRTLVSELRSKSYLDARGFIIRTPERIVEEIRAGGGAQFPAFAALSPLAQGDVVDALNETYADHQLFSDLARRMLAFFARF